MAYSITWPLSLPQQTVLPYAESGGVMLLRTPMDKGAAKQRRTGTRPDKLSLAWKMSGAQLVVFESFVKDTIRGVLRFGLPHPRTRQMVEARIVPAGEGTLYSVESVARDAWLVRFEVEVLP